MSQLPDDLYLAVDRYGVLKPPAALKLICFFELRHWIMLIFAGASLRAAPQAVGLFGAIPWYELAMELPVAALLLAYAYRLPETGAWARWIWRHGRELISATAVLHCLWIGWVLAGTTYWAPWPERAMAVFLLLDVLVLMRVWRWSVVGQVFEEFPRHSD